MRYALGTVIGFALLAFGLTCLCYGIAQAIEIGNCGTDRYGRSVGPACPSGTGEMIALMVGGAFVSIFGTGFLGIRGRPGEAAGVRSFGMGIAIGQLMFWAAAIVAGGVSVAVAIADVHEDDTRPGIEVVYAVAGTLVVFALIGSLIGARRKQAPDASGPWGRPGGGAAAAMPGISGLSSSAPANPFGAPPPPPSAGAFGSAPPPPGSYGSAPAMSAFGTPTPDQSANPFGAPPPAAANADAYARLDQLATLHRSGALSDAEFEAAKARILNDL